MNLPSAPRNWMRRLIASTALAVPLSLSLSFSLSLGAAAASPAPSPSPVPTGAPAADGAGGSVLGEAFESAAAGIAFRAPAGCEKLKASGMDEVVGYGDDARQWVLHVTRTATGTPIELGNPHAPDGSPLRDRETGREILGFVDYTAEQLRNANPGSEILRKDQVNVGPTKVGIVVVRFTLGAKRFLRQHAMVQASDQLYYIFSLTTPAGRTEVVDGEVSGEVDPLDKAAIDAFTTMIDSVRVIDRAPIHDDQKLRLYRTRALFLNWDERRLRELTHNTPDEIADRKANRPRDRDDAAGVDDGAYRTYYRMIRDFKDVGWAYQAELIESRDGKDGLCVYVRSHVDAPDGSVVDVGSNAFMSFDRRAEKYISALVTTAPQGPATTRPAQTYTTEFGVGKWTTRRMWSDQIGVQEKTDIEKYGDNKQPLMRIADDWTLDVTHVTKTGTGEPIHKELPMWYVPQAAGSILPRLVPLKEPKGYMFAVYVSAKREVMHRYIDVEAEKDVTFNGRRQRAVAVSDRIGLEGSRTMHYFTPAGEYLGAENADTQVTVVPTDREWLRAHGRDLNLSRPEWRENPSAGEAAPARGRGR